ncbi:O-methyltransferase [Halobacteriovorax marinus]|uniref:O-methyltransferase n=1 Tax=Halobacteriovorax marinus TaxID=97084 RepID=UPI003A94A52D
MNFLDERILNYSIDKSSCPSKHCDDLELFTKENHPLHRMLCGKLEASLLKFLIHLSGAKSVLELGTFTGYSALAMAEALPIDGRVTTIDKNKKINEISSKFWKESKDGEKIRALFGDGLEVLETLDEEFDLIFIDADKRNYKAYFDKCLSLLSKSGFIVVDNVLWSGRVVEEIGKELEQDKSTEYLVEFNNYISSRDDLVKTLLPIRDGIYLIKRDSNA